MMKQEMFTFNSTDDSDEAYQGNSSSESFKKICATFLIKLENKESILQVMKIQRGVK